MGDKIKLTKFSTLRGWGCKVPQDVLNKLISNVYSTSDENKTEKDDSIGTNNLTID